MLQNQTDVAVEEELENVIITMRQTSGTTTRTTSTLPEQLQKTPVKQMRVYSLDECTLVRLLKNS